MTGLDAAALDLIVRVALEATETEYPHKLDQELHADADLRPPRELNPSFYGSYDWHSAVHGHWLLVRAVSRGLEPQLAARVVGHLDAHLRPEPLAGELAFFAGAGGRSAERPYGWAWLVALHAECVAAGTPQARRWGHALAPLAAELDGRLRTYLDATLAYPIRVGTHANTAFSLELALRAARRRGDRASAEALAALARRHFVDAPAPAWSHAPAGDAFLSPPLAEASLLSAVLDASELGAWLTAGQPPPEAWAAPRFERDGADPGTVHLEGLLVSRAWALRALARALPDAHPLTAAIARGAGEHLALVGELRPGEGFNRAHWLPTFVLYLDER